MLLYSVLHPPKTCRKQAYGSKCSPRNPTTLLTIPKSQLNQYQRRCPLHRRPSSGLLRHAHRGRAVQGKLPLPTLHPTIVTNPNTDTLQRYNPELQKRSLANRESTQQEFDDFVNKLKVYSKSNKPIWTVAAEDEARQQQNTLVEQQKIAADIQKRRDEIKRQALSGK